MTLKILPNAGLNYVVNMLTALAKLTFAWKSYWCVNLWIGEKKDTIFDLNIWICDSSVKSHEPELSVINNNNILLFSPILYRLVYFIGDRAEVMFDIGESTQLLMNTLCNVNFIIICIIFNSSPFNLNIFT